MKLFALLAVIAVAAADICEHDDANFEGIGAIESVATMYANMYTNECQIEDVGSLADLFFSNDACVALFNAGYCYGNVAYARYEGEDEKSLEWAAVSEGIEDVRYMGKLACRKVEDCFTPMKEAAVGCWNDETSGFKQEILDNAATLYDMASAYAASYQESNKKDMVSVLMEMGMSEFDSFEAIREAVLENSEEIQEGWDSVVETASEFCDAECVDASADYATATLDETKGHGKCHKVGKFCGGCKNAMSLYFESNPPPCCLTTVIDAALDRFDEFYEENEEEILEVVEEVKENVDKKGKGKISKFEKESKCAREAYNAKGECVEAEEEAEEEVMEEEA